MIPDPHPTTTPTAPADVGSSTLPDQPDAVVAVQAGRRPRRWLPITAVAAGVALLVGGLWWIGSKVKSPEQRAAEAAAPQASPIGVPVEYRVLADTIVKRGDVKPAGAVNVVWTGTAGTGVSAGIVTATPHAVGDQVVEGQVVIEVAGRPVLLVAGRLPIYRDLTPGASGDDVAQLQDILTRLGFEPGEHDGVFGPGTKLAVEGWYRAVGYEPAVTSKDAAVQLAEAKTAIDEANDALTVAQVGLMKAARGATPAQLLEAQSAVDSAVRSLDDAKTARTAQTGQAQAELDAATAAYDRIKADPTAAAADVDTARVAVVTAQSSLDTIRASTATAVANAQDALRIAQAHQTETIAPPDVAEAQTAVDAAVKRVFTTQAAYDALDKVTGVMVPASEIVVIPAAPASIAALNVAVGAKAEGTLVTLTSSGLIVESLLDVSDAQLVQPGATVTLDSELASETRTGTVISVAADPVVPSEQNGQQSGYPVIIDTDEPLGLEWLGRNVRVTITNAATQGKTLVVPEAAVYAQADGTTNVTKLDPTTNTQTDLEVTVGLTAGGYASVTPTTPDALKEGDLVVVGTQPAGQPPVSNPAA